VASDERASPATGNGESVAVRPLRLATYNIHKFVGNDGRRDPQRIVQVLHELDADILCIQEFDARRTRGTLLSLNDIENELGVTALVHPTREGRRGYHGNLILTKFPAHAVERHDIGRGADEFEKRGLMVADLQVQGTHIRIANTHLALWPPARLRQATRLTGQLTAPDDGILVLAGDLNEWLPIGGCRPLFLGAWGAHPAPATFPATRPVVAFDQVWVAPRRCLARLEVHRSPLARVASDHLPLKADLEVAAAVGANARPTMQDPWAGLTIPAA
jgi:endonuclease/exonuclease/phosphatase family metal-dependent hydrolase